MDLAGGFGVDFAVFLFEIFDQFLVYALQLEFPPDLITNLTPYQLQKMVYKLAFLSQILLNRAPKKTPKLLPPSLVPTTNRQKSSLSSNHLRRIINIPPILILPLFRTLIL